jgi:hypothetical protein
MFDAAAKHADVFVWWFAFDGASKQFNTVPLPIKVSTTGLENPQGYETP